MTFLGHPFTKTFGEVPVGEFFKLTKTSALYWKVDQYVGLDIDRRDVLISDATPVIPWVAVPVADLRSVVVCHADRTSEIPLIERGVEIRQFDSGVFRIVEVYGLRLFKTNGEWDTYHRDEDESAFDWPDLDAAMKAARAAVAAAKKEAGR